MNPRIGRGGEIQDGRRKFPRAGREITPAAVNISPLAPRFASIARPQCPGPESKISRHSSPSSDPNWRPLASLSPRPSPPYNSRGTRPPRVWCSPSSESTGPRSRGSRSLRDTHVCFFPRGRRPWAVACGGECCPAAWTLAAAGSAVGSRGRTRCTPSRRWGTAARLWSPWCCSLYKPGHAALVESEERNAKKTMVWNQMNINNK